MSDPSVFVLQTSNSPRPVTQTSKSTRPVTQTSNSTHLVSQESYSTFILSWSPHPSSSMSQPSNPLLLSEPNRLKAKLFDVCLFSREQHFACFNTKTKDFGIEF
ncbi:unnamed protein product [Rotaria sordida]|uniref:Uncharacterized protein n=1 Tax=Rotaria sordida TaxID=392033 RepID=A0A819LLG7_9BILA|nr:unnamed protein product [Rotaria sordida]